MEILLVRHGESVGNALGQMQGHQDFPPSERGRAQARTLGHWLCERAPAWDVAYTSPLARARQTAEILAEVSGRAAAIVEPALAEIRAGELEGLTREDMIERHPGFLERDVT